MKLKLSILTPSLLMTITTLFGKETKQNIIFIMADDLGWSDLQCYGSDFYETPCLDAFAQTGVMFTDAYSASPLSSPTRASILTGQYPGRLRFTTPRGHVSKVVLDPKESSEAASWFKAATPETRTRLPNEYHTFAEVLKENDYFTAFMGKWHLGRDPYIPENQGFDVVVGGREHPGPPSPGHYFSPWDIETLPVVPSGTHISDVLTDEAIKYIKGNKKNPFLLCLWYYDVHGPFQAKENIKHRYDAKLNSNYKQRSSIMGAMIETLDTNVGRVLQTIQNLGLENKTIVIFTSDNGGNMSSWIEGALATNNYPLRCGKGTNYEGGVRVPLIVRVPGVTKSGTVSKVVTSSVDHYATLLDLLNIPFPEQVITDGVSYVPALEGKDYERIPIYSTFCHNMVVAGNRPNISMREGPWKFYKFYFDGENQEHRYELYNLKQDIGEINNLYSRMPERVKQMAKMIDTHAEDAEILLPRKNKNYIGNVAAAWKGAVDTEISVLDKTLHIYSKGTNPFIETIYTPNIDNTTVRLLFEMNSRSNGIGKVSWKSRKDTDYTENNCKVIQSIHDGEWHEYSINFPIKAVLQRIRVKPSSGKGLVKLRNIRIETSDGHYIRDWPLF